ncbi:conserved hypothetical protein [Culex quinquefasciatus]|uniref:Uncharacterized protein n=1 Tax=Culex quinquefasciatus TaxID=7176 RepID=B0VZV0_CULQU|nr:conserved hypothetical protein [Culex quinquefasciatus]|eukprot:XP_001841984.1 conserved hypothetical protein [Culex quinquefasciatus]
MLHVYNTCGIVRARQLPFWIDFRERHPTEDLPSARELRAMFFDDVLLNPENYEDLPYAVIQYLNPRFNRFDPAVLEAGDVIEGEDFQLNVPAALGADGAARMSFEQLAEYVNRPATLVTRNAPLAPLNVQLVSTASRPADDDGLRVRFAQVLSEMIWTEEEKFEKPVLELAEIRARIVTLARSGISLLDIMEPSMQSYLLINGTSEPPNVDPEEQVVPAMAPPPPPPVVTDKSTRKRWHSFDDSGFGASPSKRSRLFTPSTISARKARLRRIVSTPGDM